MPVNDRTPVLVETIALGRLVGPVNDNIAVKPFVTDLTRLVGPVNVRVAVLAASVIALSNLPVNDRAPVIPLVIALTKLVGPVNVNVPVLPDPIALVRLVGPVNDKLPEMDWVFCTDGVVINGNGVALNSLPRTPLPLGPGEKGLANEGKTPAYGAIGNDKTPACQAREVLSVLDTEATSLRLNPRQLPFCGSQNAIVMFEDALPPDVPVWPSALNTTPFVPGNCEPPDSVSVFGPFHAIN